MKHFYSSRKVENKSVFKNDACAVFYFEMLHQCGLTRLLILFRVSHATELLLIYIDFWT